MFAQRCICGNLPRNNCVITMQVVGIPCILPNSYRGVTHERRIFFPSLETVPSSPHRSRLVRWRCLGSDPECPNLFVASADRSGSGGHSNRRTAAFSPSKASGFVGTTRIAIRDWNRLPEIGRRLLEGAASAEDCTISEGRIRLHTRQSLLVVHNLPSSGRCGECPQASDQGAPEAAQPGRDRAEGNTPGGQSPH